MLLISRDNLVEKNNKKVLKFTQNLSLSFYDIALLSFGLKA